MAITGLPSLSAINELKIAQVANALYGYVVGATTNSAVLADIDSVAAINNNVQTAFDTVVNIYYTYSFGNSTAAAVAASVATNLGLVAGSNGLAQTDVDAAVAYISAQISAAPGAEGAAIAGLLNDWSGLAGDATYGAAATAWNAAIADAQAYTASGATADYAVGSAFTYPLTTGVDNMTGTSGADAFQAYTLNNGNTLQDGDVLDGGAGADTLTADMTSYSNAITPQTSSIETVVLRAQTTTSDATNGNNMDPSTVQIDAQRMEGVNRWETNNSRSDVIIEDVRIGDSQRTKDITIAMVETDPGDVDLGVYFDQFSLRNASVSTSTLSLQVMDTASVVAGTAPLLNVPYDGFTFTANDVVVTLGGADNPTDAAAIGAAQTYAELVTAFQAAADAVLGSGAVTVSVGSNFTVSDTASGTLVTGQEITITASGAVTITTPTGSGWSATGVVPAASGLHTAMSSGSGGTTELVTSTVILDDVGRGSTGGDLVIGGLSVGDTSTSRGVERFEITVNDNSKLQTINSTNNALREVVIVNGTTSDAITDAYTSTTANAGALTVNGKVGADATLDGVETGSASATHDSAGFTDVRLIDGSAMTGKFAFTAAVTSDSIAKYVTAVDTSANPAADVAGSGNVNFDVKGANFIYNGGSNNDTMTVTVDSAVVGSRSTIVSGLSDFTFDIAGGSGNDTITVSVEDVAGRQGGDQAWYTNQALNDNLSITGGDGNDTIKTPGAGDAIIDAGAGDDTVYTDNTGSQAIAAPADAAAALAAVAYSNAIADELADGLAANVASNATGFVYVAGGEAAGTAVTTAAAAAALNTLNLITPNGTHAAVVAAGGAIPVHSVVIAGINAATAAGGLTFAQNIALNTAYGNWTTAGSVTAATTMVNQAITGSVATVDGTVITAAQYDAGNALLETYIAAAKAAAATATSNDTLVAAGEEYNAAAAAPAAGELLNATQQALIVADMAVNKVYDPLAVSGLTFTPVVTQGVTAVAGVKEVFTVDFTGIVIGGVGANTVVFDGVATAGLAAGATAAQVATAVSAAGATASWTPAAAVGNTVTFTANAAAAIADVVTGGFTETGAGNTHAAAITVGTQGVTAVVGVTESAAVTIGGVAAATETITFDGVTHNVGGLTNTAIAALINAAADGTGWTDANVGAVVTFTSATANTNVTDIAAGDFVSSVSAAAAAGTQTTVTNLATLSSALVAGATDAQVVTALQAAIANGSVSVANAGLLFTAATSSGVNSINATDLAAIAMVLTPLQTAAANANTTAAATLTAATTANDTVVAAAVAVAAAGPAAAATTATTDDTTADAAVTAATTALSTLTTKDANLAALKAAIIVGTTDLATATATSNAVANASISAADKVAIDAAAGAAVPAVAGVVSAAEKTAVDLLITALQLTNETLTADATDDLANLTAIATATELAKDNAVTAAAAGNDAYSLTSTKGVYVFNTAGQAATYDNTVDDARNLADLESGANNTNNMFNVDLTVTFKGLTSTVTVAGSGYQTTDLEINQAIKLAINSDAVLSKLLSAADGPGNTLVVTSLIDGVLTAANMSVTLTAPASGSLSTTDVTAAASVYGTAATEAAVLAAMTTALTGISNRADYTDRFAESGAAGGNTNITGAASTSTSDNTVTPGTGDDVIVLGTTVGVDLVNSSNETVVFAGNFGDDVIVNFSASGMGTDDLDFTALNGSGSVTFNSKTLDQSISVAAETTANDTAAEIAALYTDSTTAIDHVYVAYDSDNIGSVYMVADAAGAGGITATLVGTIDLADTSWASLAASDFAA